MGQLVRCGLRWFSAVLSRSRGLEGLSEEILSQKLGERSSQDRAGDPGPAGVINQDPLEEELIEHAPDFAVALLVGLVAVACEVERSSERLPYILEVQLGSAIDRFG